MGEESTSDSLLSHSLATSESGWCLSSVAGVCFPQPSFLVLAAVAFRKYFMGLLLSLAHILASGATKDSWIWCPVLLYLPVSDTHVSFFCSLLVFLFTAVSMCQYGPAQLTEAADSFLWSNIMWI